MCDCWEKRDQSLRKKYAVKIADACSALALDESAADLKLSGVYGLPLQRVDGKRFKQGQPRLLQISHCPFCGAKLENKSV